MDKMEVHNYKSFVHDHTIIKEFYESVLVPLENDEVYYLLCQARKKYSTQIIKDPVIKRDILEKNDLDRLLKIIQEFSILIPLHNDSNIKLDRDMSVIYIDINPKSMFKAYKEFRTKVDDQLEEYYLHKNENVEKYAKKFRSHLMSSIAKSIGTRSLYTLFDLDTQDNTKFQLLVDYFKEKNLTHTIIWISKTKNGYHFIIKPTKKEKSILLEPFFRKTTDFELPELEIKDKGNTRTPICGTYQGGVPVEKVSLEKLL